MHFLRCELGCGFIHVQENFLITKLKLNTTKLKMFSSEAASRHELASNVSLSCLYSLQNKATTSWRKKITENENSCEQRLKKNHIIT